MRLWHRFSADQRPLSCHEVGKVLQRYLDGEADGQLTARVAEHLEDCRRCGLELEVYTQIKRSLARQAPQLPDSALQRLRRFGEQLAADGPDDDLS